MGRNICLLQKHFYNPPVGVKNHSRYRVMPMCRKTCKSVMSVFLSPLTKSGRFTERPFVPIVAFWWPRNDWNCLWQAVSDHLAEALLHMIQLFVMSFMSRPRMLLQTETCILWCRVTYGTLQWRYNGRDGVSNHQPHHGLLHRLFRLRSKLRVTGLCAGNSPVNFPHKCPVKRKVFPFDVVIMI